MRKEKGKKEGTNYLEIFLSKDFVLMTVIFIALSIYFILILPGDTRDMPNWLFSTTAQSMAALLALFGAFALFRYQNVLSRIKEETNILRVQLEKSVSIYISGLKMDMLGLDDEELFRRGNTLIRSDELKDFKVRAEINSILVSLIKLSSLYETIDRISEHVKIPLASIAFTLMASIMAFFYNTILKGKEANILLIIIFLSAMYSIYFITRYFIYSFPRKR